jgi:RNA polymerase sigma-70 factor (ECF subfamily)
LPRRAGRRTVAGAVSTTAPPRPKHFRIATDDRTLASRAARGDEQAFRVLHDRHSPGLLAFARQYVGDTAAAEDVVQTTFMTLHRTLRSGDRLKHPRAWLYQVTRNVSLNALRVAAVVDPLDALAAELEARAADVPDTVEQREELQAVIADIVALPVEQRAALTLFEVSDLSQAEVATALGVETKRVKALVFQARSALVDQRVRPPASRSGRSCSRAAAGRSTSASSVTTCAAVNNAGCSATSCVIAAGRSRCCCQCCRCCTTPRRPRPPR